MPLSSRSHQPQRLEAAGAAAADHEMVVHRDAQRLRCGDDLARHFDIGARRRGIAARVVVQLPSLSIQPVEILNDFVIWRNRWGMGLGAVARDPT